jgi:cell division protein FtsL
MDEFNNSQANVSAHQSINTTQPTSKQRSGNVLSKLLLAVLFVAVLALSGAVLFLYGDVKSIQTTLEETGGRISELEGKVAFQRSLLRPAIDAKADKVVFPELGVALPYNSVTKSLQYSSDSDNIDSGEDLFIRVTSTNINDYEISQMGCDELLFVSTKDAPLINPWVEDAGSVKLANGTTLYMQAAKAFANNEGSTEHCKQDAWLAIQPQTVADEFKKAVAY